jgi:hypothetical protein
MGSNDLKAGSQHEVKGIAEYDLDPKPQQFLGR